MELRHLKYFITVAEELHFGRAAARLSMAQPPLSQQIRQLEAELGVHLFHRTKRKVELTKEGVVFLEKVKQILHDLDHSIETVKMVSRGEIGEIIIGFIASSSYDILPMLIKSYRKAYPHIQVKLKQLTTAEQVKALDEGLLDIGILCQPFEGDSSFQIEVIRDEPMILAIPKDHPLALDSSKIQLSDVANEPFILTSRRANQSHYDIVINSCYDAGFSPTVIQETEELTTVISLVSAGMGVSLVPASVQSVLTDNVAYRMLNHATFTTKTSLAWRKENHSAIIDTFVQHVRNMHKI